MTYAAFLARLGETKDRLPWCVNSHGQVRASGCCPIVAVAGYGHSYQAMDVGRELGISLIDRRNIVLAADNRIGFTSDREVRRDLLRVLGLTEPKEPQS